MPVSPEDFAALLQREMARYNPGGDTEGARRDQAVRSANIAAGRGSSTALQRQAQAAAATAAAGEPAPAETAAVPTPQPRPTIESLFVPPEFPKYFGEQPPEPVFVPPQFPQYFGEQPPQAVAQPPLPEFPDYWGVQPPVVPEAVPRRTRFPVDLRALFQ